MLEKRITVDDKNMWIYNDKKENGIKLNINSIQLICGSDQFCNLDEVIEMPIRNLLKDNIVAMKEKLEQLADSTIIYYLDQETFTRKIFIIEPIAKDDGEVRNAIKHF
jgi:hypothetical protein